MAIDLKAMAAAAAATGPDMTQASVGGGGGTYTPPAAGPVRLRLVAYVETGKQTKKYAGKPDKIEDEVQLVFELSGPKHPPKVLEDGTKLPFRVTVKLNLSLNEKANFFKLFKRMNYKGTAKHMSELLGEPFRGVVYHNVVGEGDKAVTFANLRDDSGFSVAPPRYEDPETGETKEVVVAPAISELRLFVWNAKPEYLKPMWDSLFIDGSYGEGDKQKSKNVFQNAIKASVGYVGSPIYNLLQAGGAEPDLPDTDEVPAADERDPLDDVA
jgi:hypothetical protein